MKRFPTALAVKPHPTVPDAVWNTFVCDYPYCSKEYMLEDKDKVNTFTAVILASILENIVCWQDFKKLYNVYQTLCIMQKDSKTSSGEWKHLQRILGLLNNFIKIQPFNVNSISRGQHGQSQPQMLAAQQYLDGNRKKIFEFLEKQEEVESMADITRSVGTTIFHSQLPQNPNLRKFLNQYPSIEAAKAAVKKPPAASAQNFFILDDLILIILSHIFEYPLHTYINLMEKNSNYLIKRRIHNQSNQEKTLAFLLQFDEHKSIRSVRILYQQHESTFIKNLVSSVALPVKDARFTDLIEESLQNVFYQATRDYTQIVELWIKKIVQLLEEGEAETLIATSPNKAQISDQVRQSIQKLFQSALYDAKQTEEFLMTFQKIIGDAESLFENLVITQVTTVRDSIKPFVKQIKRNSQTQQIHAEAQLPKKPKIFQNNHLFQGNMTNSQTPQQFQQHKILSEKGRIQAKTLDSDLPYYTDSSSPGSPVVVRQVESKEYNTESDEKLSKDEFKEPNYEKIINQDEEPPQEMQALEKPAVGNKSSQKFEKHSVLHQELRSQRYSTKLSPIKKRQRSCEQKERYSAQKIQNDFLMQSLQKNRNQTNLETLKNFDPAQLKSDQLAFKPNASVKRDNLTQKMSKSQQLRPSISSEIRINDFASPHQNLELSQISEVSEVQSQLLNFECPICYCSIQDSRLIRTLHNEHKLCKTCLEDWIKIKFNSGQWNFKFFSCPIQTMSSDKMITCKHIIEQLQIKEALSDEEYKILCDKALKSNIVDIVCPNELCQATIKGMRPKSSIGLCCPQCNQKICWVCKKKDHLELKCPQRLEEIRLALQDERVSCCPECLEIYMKNDGCEHVQCTNCLIDFCFTCSAPRIPIFSHGAHYHRQGCDWRAPWINPKTGEEVLDSEFDPVGCELCQASGQPCQRPLSLQQFKQLAHLIF